jgi:hypothetical protein
MSERKKMYATPTTPLGTDSMEFDNFSPLAAITSRLSHHDPIVSVNINS